MLDGDANQLREIVRTARPDLSIPEEVGTLLVTRLVAARAAWPGIDLGEADWLEPAIAALVPDTPAIETLTALHLEDLYLARAVAAGHPGALQAFERSFSPLIARAATTVNGGDQVVDEVRQRVFVRALARRATTMPGIATFAGRSPLGLWLRAIAIRETVTLVKTGREVSEDDELSRALGPDDGPELAYMKRMYREEFARAFRSAIASLPQRDRTLLRQSVLDGLGIDRLAPLYQVHRATVARWLADARDQLLAQTRRALLQQLQISRDELDSILRMIESQLDASLHGL